MFLRYLMLAFLPCLAIFLQATLFHSYAIKGAIPDLLLIFVIYYALLNEHKKASIYGFICGLAEDLYMGRIIGINALAKGLTAYIVGKLQANVFKDYILVGVISVFMGTLLNTAIIGVVIFIINGAINLDKILLYNVFFQLVYNVMIAAPIYGWYFHAHSKGIMKKRFREK